jgi:hypothetical protein
MHQLLIRITPAIVTVFLASAIHGETLPLGTLPRNPTKASYTVSIETEPVAGDGYQPIHVTFRARARAFVRDHRVSLRLTPRNQFITSLDFSGEHYFALEQGKTTHSETIYVPYYYPWDTIDARLFEDRREVETGHASFGVSDLRRRYAQQKTSVGVIIPLDSTKQDAAWKACPDVRTLITVLGDGPLPEDVAVDRLTHKNAIDLLREVQPAWTQFRPIDEMLLHETWLGYSQLDVIIIAEPVLDRIETSKPKQMSAIIDWIAAGGNLWVYAASQSNSTFLAKCKCQTVPASKVIAKQRVAGMLDLKQKNDTSELTYEYWQGVQKKSDDYSFRDRAAKMASRADVFKKLQMDEHPFGQTSPATTIAPDIRTTTYGIGTIIVIDNEDPFPGSFQFWKSVANLYRPEQINWIDRNGVQASSGNKSYWNWLIASVGQPPVTSFIVLNTLFAIVIGPVAYFFFRSRERLYLLFFFAPAFALIVTSSLFAYAMFADGTKTRARTRQLTWMDTEHGENTTQSRQTYYAVFGSGTGLSLADDVAIFPIRISNAINRYQYHNNTPPKGTISLTKERQQLSGSYLPARNQVQYLTIHPGSFDGGLSFEFKPDAVSVTNNMPLKMHELVIRDQQGLFWSASKIPVGATAEMTRADAKVAAELIEMDFIPDTTEAPLLNANRNNASLVQSGILESKLSQWERKFPVGHFIAAADLLSGELGVNHAVIQDSVHVLMGALP